MKRVLKQFVFLLIVSAAVSSCYPGFDATVEELDLAITRYDEDQDFRQLESFYLYDTIIYITDDEEDTPPNVDEGQGPHIIAQVRENLLGMGWTENTDTVGGINADVSILISVLETDVNFYYYYWWDWWYWYPWYPGYPTYPGYPIYPGYPVYPNYGYTVGTVLIDMINVDEIGLRDVDPENPKYDIPIVWTGGVNGILSGSEVNIKNRLTTQIGQVFKQSTYLIKSEPYE